MIDVQRGEGRLRLAVQTDLTIYQVGELHAAIGAWLAEPDDWLLDLGQVSEMDGAGLQWLLYLNQQRQARGQRLTLGPLSDAVQAVLAQCPGTPLTPAE
ncbi:STAS domain-containing protein [Pseudomonas sp. DC3000-4b1]|uniref:STAS domain-containing protein n=1 Tax=unclassified Pseudomonas TaxID=196821 RepID=UPI003CFAB19F